MTPLAVQLYSVRDEMRFDRRRVLQRIAEIGYVAVEPHDPLDDPSGLRAVADEFGLRVCSSHAPVLGNRRDQAFDAVHTLGTDTAVVAMLPPERWADREGLGSIAAELNDAAEKAGRRGLRLAYHNHDWEFADVGDNCPALEALANLLAPEVLLEVDIYWAHVGGADVPTLLTHLGDRVRLLHVKDGPAVKSGFHTAVGSGEIAIETCLNAGSAAQWHIVELDHCETSVMQALADSFAYLSGASSNPTMSPG